MSEPAVDATSRARVLVIEPDPDLAAVYRRTLTPGTEAAGRPFAALGAAGPASAGDAPELVLCRSVEAGLEGCAAAAAEGGFAVAFLDAECCREDPVCALLLERLRALDPHVQLVRVGGSPQVSAKAGWPPCAALLRKPLDARELAALGATLVRAWRALAHAEATGARLLTASRIGGFGHWEWNPLTDQARWCAEFARLFALPEQARGGPVDLVWERIHPQDRMRVRAQMGRAAHDHADRALDYRIVHPEKGIRQIRQESTVAQPDGATQAWTVSAVRDASEHDAAEDAIRRLAYFDPLTELPNRSFLGEYLRNVLVHARRHDRMAAILHVDLDGFKRVNDTLGHAAGDRLLQQAALRLQSCVRDSDYVVREQGGEVWSAGCGPDTVTRFGADEFIVVLSEVASAEDPRRVAERILARLAEPVELSGRDVTVGASIGIAVFPEHADDEDTLLRNAALAMHSAKRRGRNTYQCFSESLANPGVDRLNLEATLRKALETGGLALHYQPKVDAVSGRVSGAEALLRWRHPELGMVPPSEFIPIAEETGLILPLGEWVVQEVCSQLGRWRDHGLATVPVSINVSAQQLHDHALVPKVSRALSRSGLTAPALEFEITESVLMEETGAGEARLRELRALGSLVSMDDFGTGYSSLSYLKRLPIDVVKIDRSFVRDILGEEDDQAILRAIITMAHQLRLRIVAEGVESEAQMSLLKDMNCDLIQGYVVSPPVGAEEFAQRFLSSARSIAS